MKSKILFTILSFCFLIKTATAATDVAAHQIISPVIFLCNGATFDIKVAVKNTGTDTVMNVPVFVVMSGITAGNFSGTITDTIFPDSIKIINIQTVNILTFGQYRFKIYTSLSGDLNALNDSLFQSSYISNNPANIVTQGAHACGTSSLNLFASTSNGIIYWYPSDTSSQLLTIGNNYTTPSINHTETYWVEAHSFVKTGVGPVDTSIGNHNSTIFYNDAMLFDVAQAVVLDSVAVYPVNTGRVVVRLLNPVNAILAADTFNITTIGKTFLTLNFKIPPGSNYKLDAVGTNTGLLRNTSGAHYPYNLPGVFSITGNTLNQNHFLFFYDWRFRIGGCPSARVAVDATIHNVKPIAGFTVVHNGLQIQFTNTTFDADSIYWKFGDGVDNILWSPNHNYTTTGNYTVKLYAFNDCGVDSFQQQILVSMNGIENQLELSDFKIYPSPAANELHISTTNQSNNLAVSIYDLKGMLCFQSDFKNKEMLTVDISKWATSIYLVKCMDLNSGIYRSKMIEKK